MRTLLSLCGACLPLAAQTPLPPTFAPPLRLHAGELLLGENRLFPSPVFHDIDGDGRLDIVVGDLRGHLTVALRLPGEGLRFGAESKLLARDGKALDFGNW